MGNFYTDTIKKTQGSAAPKGSRISSFGSLLRERKVQQLIKDAADQGIKLMVYETFRSQPVRPGYLRKALPS